MKCPHPHIEREILFGSPTGDWICSACGKVAPKEWLQDDRDKAETENAGVTKEPEASR
jgi:hypothetical protein